MNAIFKYMLTGALLFTWTIGPRAQSSFSPDDYRQFLLDHQNYTAQQLLDDHPPQTVYYSDRQYPADLASIPWYDSIHSYFRFTRDEKEMLSRNHFMVTERIRDYSWADAFIGLYSNDLPLFLSADFFLSTLHNSYDAILQTLEWQFLEPNLKELLHSMYEYFPGLVSKYGGNTQFEVNLQDVDLYISVALSLAEAEEFLPRFDTPEKYHEVMAAVDAAQMVHMPLFTDETRMRKLDFSQFTPRGHYNKEIYTPGGVITLEDYFKAMMWLGRIDFLLTAPPDNPWEPDWSDDELRRMQLGALLLNEVIYNCGKLENLEKHEKIISFMVGPDDNLTPGELKGLSDQALSGLDDLFDEAMFGHFIDLLNGTDDYGQKIMSNFFYVDPFSSDPGNLPVSYKVLGQKFLVDSYIFSEVVFDRIIYNDQKVWRPMPDPLDALAALGNEDALALLEGELEQYKYSSNMAGLKYLIDSYDAGFWEQSLYNTWLASIRTLNPPTSGEALPYFMKTTAWHQQKLNTQLTSWAQLRHDNILYGKQSYTGGTGCSYPYTYVEPYPGLYAGLERFALEAGQFFSEVLSGEILESRDRIMDYYQGYAEIMGRLDEIAIRELERIALSEDQVVFLKTMINGYMASGPSISGWFNDLFFDVEKGLNWDFTVADVHTQPTEFNGAVVGHVLHAGNGAINMGVFLAENPCQPGKLMAFAGPVSSYHQKVTSNFERLTDQQWEELFLWQDADNYPERPDWVASYLLDGDGNFLDSGRALKGALYTGTGSISELEPFSYDYLLLFPNPASTEAHLRFVLNMPEIFSMEIYDTSGRKIHVSSKRLLQPAEHRIPLPVEYLEEGLYLVRVAIGNRYETKELLVR